MNHCFLCGRPLKAGSTLARRKLRTGEWLRKSYRTKKVASVNVHYGERVVCRRCAARLDREARLKELNAYLPELVVILAMLLAILFR
jgi:predicted nucleic acid-binding Zn ribbon protein